MTGCSFSVEEIPLDGVFGPSLVGALDHWRRLGDGSGLPDRAAFDPIDLWPLLPLVALTQPWPDGDQSCRVLGTDLCHLLKRELTGRTIGLLTPRAVATDWLDHLAAVTRLGQPTVRRLMLRAPADDPAESTSFGRPWPAMRRVDRLVLPFTTDGGRSVTRLLSVHHMHVPLPAIEAWFAATQRDEALAGRPTVATAAVA